MLLHFYRVVEHDSFVQFWLRSTRNCKLFPLVGKKGVYKMRDDFILLDLRMLLVGIFLAAIL